MPTFALKEYLEKKNLSVRKFAKMMDMRYDNIWRVLRPGYDPKLSFVLKCMAVLKCRLRDLTKD